ncbi:dead deah box dna helicase [Diplodia corticola]|uniref:DNA 3'-5' helicase n=1 Tax=Diplodia corticola TaxID=236234 RepID=A0A1J9RK33_9PEZI|nr:dead deah box dna helicase [Diplodia corticola]OJD40841.1 dead deah box dna helicase [Diplodia corticola]
MDDSVFEILDGLETGRARSHDSDHFTQHSHNPDAHRGYQSFQPAVHHQRYPMYRREMSHHDNGGNTKRLRAHDYDDFDGDVLFDDFDHELLRQPSDDRTKQAQEGRARLSLAPAGTGQQYAKPVEGHHGYYQGAGQGAFQHSLDAHQSQSVYCPFMSQNSSSPRFLPSSPTIRATQRDLVQRRPSHTKKRQMPRNIEQADPIDDFQTDFIKPQPLQQRRPNGMPVVQGIELVSTHELPDRFRTVFPFPAFNAVQSKCFMDVYGTNNNFVVCAPTGSGKTVIFELAILRLISGHASGSFKAVYQAPTKALCCERQRDWEKKFKSLDLKVKELTGDTTNEQLHDVQTADLIVTTPEKWDSMTRRWKDHERLVQMVKLFLIDEVHILKEDRGATLEAVVSRMKSVGTDVRFVALSATVPNFEDIATWLGKNSTNQDIPARKERFGEEFRPVQLQKHVLGFGGNNPSEFAFDKVLTTKLPGVIARYSQKKPIMVFCFTRKSCEETASSLARWWNESEPRQRFWEQPRRLPVFEETALRDCAISGVAFHHAGLSLSDKQAIEKAYLAGELNVICCTSTLAVGVNLPCHLVIIKNTIAYVHPVTRECSDLEIMQMLGRAGRPQFDDNAVAVIITKNEKVRRYELMVSGKEILESRLHLNLIEHLNAEIGLRTIWDLQSAKKWLRGTFLYVRLQQNPTHYEIEGDVPGSTLDERLENICVRGLELLACSDLTEGDAKIRLTEYGEIMARYAVRHDTMQYFIALEPQAKLSEILSAICSASEFREVRFRQTEKRFYKILNSSPGIKFPILVNLDLIPHKISLIIQAVLGGVDMPNDEDLARQRTQYNQDFNLVFQHTRRLIRCVVDCAIHKEDSAMVRNALILSRSMCSRVWDDSPLTMKQVESIGPVGVRKLVNAGIRSIDELELAEAQRLETILGKHPPYGNSLLAKVKEFPRLRVSLKQMKGVERRSAQTVTVNFKAEIGFINGKPPLTLGRGPSRIPLFICLMAETSLGKMVHFRRTSAAKLGKGQEVLFCAELTGLNQFVTCYVMCDDVAGTMKYATVQPEIPAHLQAHLRMNISKRRMENTTQQPQPPPSSNSDEYGDGGIDDSDLIDVDDFVDIDQLPVYSPANTAVGPHRSQKMAKQNTSGTGVTRQAADEPTEAHSNGASKKLDNGKWACNHKCKNKQQCKHLCCKDGLDKAPKPAKATGHEAGNSTQRGKKCPNNKHLITDGKTQTRLNPSKSGLNTGAGTLRNVESLDLTGLESQPVPQARQGYEKLRAEAKRALPETTPVSVGISNKRPRHSYRRGEPSRLSFLQREREEETSPPITSENDYIEPIEEMASTRAYGTKSNSAYHHQQDDEYLFHGDGDLFADIMAGVAFLDQNPDPRAPEKKSKQAREQQKSPEPTIHRGLAPQKEAHPSLKSSRSWSPEHPAGGLRPAFQERSYTSTPPPPRSAGGSTSSLNSPRVARKPLRALDTSSVRSQSTTSSRLRCMNPDPDPLSPEEPSPQAIPPGLEDVDPWLIAEYAAFVNFT